jgi:hypothetical protein
MDSYIEDLQSVVEKHLQFSRNVVNSQVTLFQEKIQSDISNFNYKDVHDFFSVRYYKPEPIFANHFLLEELQGYESIKTTAKGNLNTKVLHTLPDFNLVSYLKTGIQEYDEDIVNFINAITVPKALEYIASQVDEFSMPINVALEYACVNYLFYRNLSVNTDIQLAKSLVELRQESANSRDYFAVRLNMLLDSYRVSVKNLVLFTTDSDFKFSYHATSPIKLTILQESFDAFAEEGGNIDMLFGYIASNNASYDVTASDILIAKDKFLSAWDSVKTLYTISINNSKLDMFRMLVTNCFDSSLMELTEEEKEYIGTNNAYTEETKKLGYEFIDNLELSDMSCIEDIALELVAGIRFRFSSSYYLLSKMKNYLEINDDIDPMEAALYASVDYMVKYLVDQISIIKR